MPEPIYIVGPTCTGKSQIAVFLAQKINAEIVSCDSMLVYRGMDIATAKPSREEQRKVPHYMIDIVDIGREYDVFQYKEAAGKVIADIQKRNKIPLITGGTGLYVKSLTDGLFEISGEDKNVRVGLQNRIEREGLSALYEELKKVDPVSCMKIKPNDKRRIVRALEVYYITGKPISFYQCQWDKKRDCIIIGLNRTREDLYKRIGERVDLMFRVGLIGETKTLIGRGVMRNKTAWQALGYKEIAGYLEGKCSLSEAQELLKQNTRRFAKRQLTWFMKDDRVKWFLIDEKKSLFNVSERIADYLDREINTWRKENRKV